MPTPLQLPACVMYLMHLLVCVFFKAHPCSDSVASTPLTKSDQLNPFSYNLAICSRKYKILFHMVNINAKYHIPFKRG
jgi:hypothetical protein